MKKGFKLYKTEKVFNQIDLKIYKKDKIYLGVFKFAGNVYQKLIELGSPHIQSSVVKYPITYNSEEMILNSLMDRAKITLKYYSGSLPDRYYSNLDEKLKYENQLERSEIKQ